LLSASGNFIVTGGGNLISAGGNLLTTSGETLLSAGDKLRDLIVPDALATLVSTPAWIPGVGGIGKKGGLGDKASGERAEKVRKELDEMLASACPLCESVVAGLDKPFVNEGEIDTSWEL
jgi:vacuolar protein sorting-associated protein 18